MKTTMIRLLGLAAAALFGSKVVRVTEPSEFF